MQIELTEEEAAIIGMALCYVGHSVEAGGPAFEMTIAARSFQDKIPALAGKIIDAIPARMPTGDELARAAGKPQ